MHKILLLTGRSGSGKSTLAQQTGKFQGWKCRFYDGLNPDAVWSAPAHPLEVELVAIDHLAFAPPFDTQELVAWCKEHRIPLLLVEQTRDDIERLLGPLVADELQLFGRHEHAKYIAADGSGPLSVPPEMFDHVQVAGVAAG